MDSLTQATLGAAIGEAILGKKIGRKAAILGAIGGTIPDLDVLLTPFFSEFQKISIHRGYSHSILFCLLGAFLFAYFLSRIKRAKEISFQRLWLFSFLALFTHVLLDAFTTYGTQLFLPFTDWRVSFDSINIVDPFYTVPLLLGVLGSVFWYEKQSKKRSVPNSVGLIISSLYLLFTLGNKQHIEQVFSSQLAAQNTPYFSLLTVPVKVGNVTWYGVAKDKNSLHIGKYSMLKNNKIEFHSFPINEQLLAGLDDQLTDRMKWFAQGFYTVAAKDGKIRIYNMQCDMQGVRAFGDYKAPTAFFFEILPKENGDYELSSDMEQEGVIQ
ncbi:MAG: metal-dependent hydrolase [Flavobacteriales bacterium]|nr:metal-dependent hydrolase [Flavobacteriales bacterium]